MASSSSAVEDEFVGALHAVVPLTSCPHLDKVTELPTGGINVDAACSDCGISAEVWVCLTCFDANCGRYVHEHALMHAVTKEHPMALSLADLSVWCYPCEAYVHNERCHPHKNDVHVKRFGEAAPV